MLKKPKIDDTAERLKREGTPYVLATVVRTVAATAAKAGAKAIILGDGAIADGWIGGGCARGAVLKAARDALADGEPRLISVQPEDLLTELGVSPGDMKDGIRFARNMCPSKGSMDIFIEPVRPVPELYVLGASPVAVALAELAPRFGFLAIACAPAEDQHVFADPDERVEGFLLPSEPASDRFVVVSTQGRGDEAALRAAISAPSVHVAFVGSRAKARALKDKLVAGGVAEEDLDRLKAPAGLDIGAVTPEEIALSILAELIMVRRRAQKQRMIEEPALNGAAESGHAISVAEKPSIAAVDAEAPPAGIMARFSPIAALSRAVSRLEAGAPPVDLMLRIHSCCS